MTKPQPAWMMVDADVGCVTARLHLNFDHATAVRGVDTVSRRGSEVDGLMQAVGEMEVTAGWIRWIVGEDELGAVRRHPRKFPAAKRVEAAVLEAELQRQPYCLPCDCASGSRSSGSSSHPRASMAKRFRTAHVRGPLSPHVRSARCCLASGGSGGRGRRHDGPGGRHLRLRYC
jgi:hypothetical protein